MKKKIRDSLTAKILLLTAGLLLFVSLVTYGAIASFLPVTYRNVLEQDLQQVSQELKEELEQYDSVAEAENLLYLFAANNQAAVTLLDPEGNLVFQDGSMAFESGGIAVEKSIVQMEGAAGEESIVQMEGTAGEESVTWEVSEEDNQGPKTEAAEENGLSEKTEVTENDLNGSRKAETENDLSRSADAAENDLVIEMNSAAGNSSSMENEAGTGEGTAEIYSGNSAVKSYQVEIGDTAYTMLVAGTMEAVSQTMAVLEKILPIIFGIVLLLSFLCALAASLYLTRPVMELSQISRRMAALDFTEHCRENRSDEVGVLARSLNELSGNLSAALEELREANRKLTFFFAAASHELKTPVTVLKGHLGGMIKNVGAYQDRERYLNRSYEVTEQLEGMVKDILAVSRMESGALEKKPKKMDLAELLRIQAGELLELLEEKGMKLGLEAPKHLECVADPAMMEKVIRNLLTNAIRYSPEGSAVRMVLEKQEEKVCFFIENTGVHIPEGSITKIFDAFYRVEDSRNRKSGGSGLGLYIVKMMLEQHGAEYGAANSRDGVAVWFRMSSGRYTEKIT